MKKTILFVVAESKSANGVCCHAVMQRLKDNYNVLCLTNREWREKQNYEADGISYFTVKPRFTSRLYEHACHSEDGSLRRHVLNVLFFVINKLKLLTSIFTWPWLSPLYTERFYKQMERLYTQYGVDCIVPVYKQIDPLIAAKRLKKKLISNGKDIQVIPYFLDPLSGGIGPQIFTEGMMVKRGQAWERRVLDIADSVIVMESSRRNHEENNSDQDYYKKLVYMDIPLLNLDTFRNKNEEVDRKSSSTDNIELPNNSDEIRVFYGGTLHEAMRNVRRMIELIGYVNNPKIHFVFAGYGAREKLFEGKDNIEFLGELSHEELKEQLDKANILLNMGVTRSTAISGKIFEYMTTGKPIVSTFSIDREACIPYLRKYPLSFMVDERERNMVKQAAELEQFIVDNSMKMVPMDYIQETFRKNMPEMTAEYLCTAMEGYHI